MASQQRFAFYKNRYNFNRQGFTFNRNSLTLQNGFTLLELVVVMVIASVLAVILLNRLWYYQEIAEKTAMEMTVMNMRSGLRLRIAELMMQNRMDETVKLMYENPITWLATLPPNYMGKISGSKKTALIPGNWYFDVGQQELVYLVQHDRFFKPGSNGDRHGKKHIRFHVTAMKPARQDSNGTVRKAEGITLTPITQYHWF